ncbi:Uncharacterised protein [Mycobacteroides abscessus subsp. abscessus]|nr:hypothetical protein [Dechloromonas sp.]SLE90894.1 Uncharacterised protein [Mycobacteroides abscessus subsp. abscessus]
MLPTDRFTHEFVDFIPADLDAGVLYVSLPYATVMHLCACGCAGCVQQSGVRVGPDQRYRRVVAD